MPMTPRAIKELQEKEKKSLSPKMRRILEKQKEKTNPSEIPTEHTNAMNITDHGPGDSDLTGQSGASIAGDTYNESFIGTGPGSSVSYAS